MGNFIINNTNSVLRFAETQTNTIIASTWLPIICALIFIALGEGSLLILIIIAALKLNNEFHQLTASQPTAMSQVFRGIITVMLGFSAWNYPLHEYLSLFLLMLSVVIGAWILALSNLYPFTEQNSSYSNKPSSTSSYNIKHSVNGSSHRILPNFSNVGNITTISGVDSSFNSTGGGGGHSILGSSSIADSFHYSPNRDRFQSRVQSNGPKSVPLRSNSNILNTSSLPFEEDHNRTLICDDYPAENMMTSNITTSMNSTLSTGGNPYGVPSVGRSNTMNLNKMSSNTASNEEISRIATLAEPTNFFQALVGFSSVNCTLNALSIFEENQKRDIVASMTEQNYFHLNTLHFTSMMVDVFSFILIPFFLYHILLFYQSQHSMIPIAYVLSILFVNQYGEYMVTSVFAGHPGVARKNVLSHSISDKFSLEGTLISIMVSSISALVMFWAMGVIVFGRMCGPLRTALKMNPSLRDQCVNDQCLFCEGSFVGMGWTEHLVVGALLAMQSVLGQLMMELVIKAYEFKLVEVTQGIMAGNGVNVLWMRKCSPFLFAFAVTFYYLL